MGRGKTYLSLTDMFCGAGGSSAGAVAAGVTPEMALNHWKLAIDTHNHNFPDTDHDCTDVQACDPRRYPSTDILLASPECTNHSLAKGVARRHAAQGLLFGGQIDPAAERSRATMWDVPRFAEYHRYRVIVVENVPDARRWECWDAWLMAMSSLGYDHRALYLNSQFFGVPQSRNRLYVVFWRRGNPAPNLEFSPRARCQKCGPVDSVQSWKDPRKQWGGYGRAGQYVYRCPRCAAEVFPAIVPAAAAIDWNLKAQRIGDRKEPLKPKTVARIEAGLRRFAGRHLVVGNYTPGWTRPADVEPFGTVTTADHQSVCTVPEPFLTSYYGTGEGAASVKNPLPAVTTVDRCGLVCPPFVVQTAHPAAANEKKSYPVDGPLPVQTTQAELAVCVPMVVEAKQHVTPKFTNEPLGTVVAGGNHHYLLNVPMVMETRGQHRLQPASEEPVSTVTACATQHWLVDAPMIVEMRSGQDSRPVTEPLSTLTAHAVNHYLLNAPIFAMQRSGAFTRFVDTGETCNPLTIPAVDDCGFRMLEPHEIQSAMAFERAYAILGNKRQKIRLLGNAVTPPVMRWIVERIVASLEGK